MSDEFPKGAFPTDSGGNEGIEPPVDEVASGMVGLWVDRLDPTGQALGAAQMQAQQAIANVNIAYDTGGTGGVAPDGRTDQVG